jgi:hypothetical protein
LKSKYHHLAIASPLNPETNLQPTTMSDPSVPPPQDPTANADLPPYELSTGEEATMTSLERRNSLEKHLQHRPDEKDLKDRHILLDTTAAPALQARQAELERKKVTDNLRKVRSCIVVQRSRSCCFHMLASCYRPLC